MLGHGDDRRIPVTADVGEFYGTGSYHEGGA